MRTFSPTPYESGHDKPYFLFLLLSLGTDGSSSQVWWMAKFRIQQREKHYPWAIKTIYKKQIRGMLQRIPLDPKV